MSSVGVRRVVVFALVTLSLFVAAASPTFAQSDGGPQASAPRRPAVLAPLYISFSSLQAVDVLWTRWALEHGAVEANPIVAAVGTSPAALVAIKTASTLAAIGATEWLWKRNRAVAIALMIGANSTYAMVVSHNYAVASKRHRSR